MSGRCERQQPESRIFRNRGAFFALAGGAGAGHSWVMDEPEFEIVDNKKSELARHSLERLKALAPTFPERSPHRLACMELIAERERAEAREVLRVAGRRASLALLLSIVALVAPVIIFVAWTFLIQDRVANPFLKKPEPVVIEVPVVVRPSPTPAPTPVPTPEPVAEPLPPLLLFEPSGPAASASE